MNLELLIVADDLTGAVDTAVQFSKQGIPAAVALRSDFDYGHISPAIKILAINTGSRHDPSAAAFERIMKTVAQAKSRGVSRFYKKIDSTFRGNVGAELEAFMQAAGSRQLMLVAAYPKAGRTIRGGVVYVNDSPLHASSFSADPLNPVTESAVPAILARQTGCPVHCMGTATPAGPDMAAESRGGIFLFDAETDDELRTTGEVLAKAEKLRCCAGSAGFAELLPRLYGLSPSAMEPAVFSGRLLVINGSLNETSLGQVRHAAAAGIPCFTLEPGRERELADSIVRQLNDSGCAVVTSPPAAVAAGCGAVADALGRCASAALAAAADASVAVFGGDTAAAVCAALRRTVLYPRGEIAPGCALCSASAGDGGRAWVLKSGGFGPPDIIDRIRNVLSTG